MTRPAAIRRLDASDAEPFRALRLAALREAPEAFGSTYAIEAARPITEYRERLTSSTVLGAHCDGELVGIVGFKRETGEKNAHKAFVWGMYVRAGFRRRGIGSALVDAMTRSAAGKVEQLTLTVVQGNDAATTLYEKAGFFAYGVEPRSLKTPAGYLDEVLMVRFLS